MLNLHFENNYFHVISGKRATLHNNENAAGEYYLTDAIAIARKAGLKCAVVECDAQEVAGANTREELALLESFYKQRKAV